MQQAKGIKKIEIVSFDWFEDSLMQKRPLREQDFRMDRRVREIAQRKQRKKAKREANIAEGSMASSLPSIAIPCNAEVDQTLVKRFERGCQEFVENMNAGKLLFHRFKPSQLTYA